MISNLSFRLPNVAPTDGARSKAYLQWYQLLHSYTMTSLSHQTDIFAALMGIAQQVQNTLLTRYLAGIWEGDLIRGLLWRPRHQVYVGQWAPLTRPVDREGKPLKRAPSWSWAAVVGPTTHIVAERHEAKYCDPANWGVKSRLRDSDPMRWTAQSDCDVDRVGMPECELQMLGKPLQVRIVILDQLAGDYARSTRSKGWSTSRATMNKHGVLLEAADSPGHIIAMGVFDIPSEAESYKKLYCLRLIKDEGLLLQQHGAQRYTHVGIFVPQKEEPFSSAPITDINLI